MVVTQSGGKVSDRAFNSGLTAKIGEFIIDKIFAVFCDTLSRQSVADADSCQPLVNPALPDPCPIVEIEHRQLAILSDHEAQLH